MLQIQVQKLNAWTRSDDGRQTLFLIGFLLSTLGASLTNIALAYQYLLRPTGVEQYAVLMYGATLSALVGASYIGSQADRLGRFDRSLLGINLSNAATSAVLACSPPFAIVVALVVASTALSLCNAIIVRKLLPEFFLGPILRHVTAWLTEITAVGAVFGPLLGPLFPMLGISLSAMFAIDALTFTATGIIYWQCFRSSRTSLKPVASPPSPYRGIMVSLRDSARLFHNKSLRLLIVAYAPFSLGLSSLFFSLALFNKHLAEGSEIAYAVPIVAMFCGRTIASRYARSRHFSFTYPGFFTLGTTIAFVALLMIALSKALVVFALLQFVLGAGLSIALFAHAMWLQTECGKDSLGLANGTLRAIDAGTKLVGIPLVATLASHELLWVIAVAVGGCFGLSSLSVLKRLGKIGNVIPLKAKSLD